MSESTKVTSLFGTAEGVSVRAQLVQTVAASAEIFESDGCQPTGIVYVLFDDEGNYREGWHSFGDKFPASACIGMAIRALTRAE